MQPKFLSIVIPYYKESPEELFPLLASINNQTGLDLSLTEVILVNDGAANVLSKEFLASFTKLEIRVLMLEENGGPGVVRQAGLDAARGEYVIFCDADDTLYHVAVLAVLTQELSAHKPDVLVSAWLEEQKSGESWSYQEHRDDRTWMFGKAFKTRFLRGNDIRFHTQLRVQEDSYFNALACEMAENVRVIDQITYVWKYRDKSITRKDSYAYTFWSFSEYIKSAVYAIEELFHRGYVHNLPRRIMQLVFYAFFVLHQADWQEEKAAAYLKESEETLASLIAPYISCVKELSQETVKEMYSCERERSFRNEMESEFFPDWLERIGLELN